MLSGLALAGAIVAAAVGSDGIRPEPVVSADATPESGHRTALPEFVSLEPVPSRAVEGRLPWSRWDPRPYFDASEAAVEIERILDLPADPDDIPPIDRPRFITSDKAHWLSPTDEVLGVALDRKEARCYPLSILRWHHVVNDSVAGYSIGVYYDPLTQTAMGFSRKGNEESIEFGASGKSLDGCELLYDRSGRGLWHPITGAKVCGKGAGDAHLYPLRVTRTTWAAWKRAHRKTLVLSRNTGLARPYGLRGSLTTMAGKPPAARSGPGTPGIAPDTRVLGLRVYGLTVAVIPPKQAPEGPLRKTIKMGSKQIRVEYDARTTSQRFEAALEPSHVTAQLTCSWWAWAAAYPKTQVAVLAR